MTTHNTDGLSSNPNPEMVEPWFQAAVSGDDASLSKLLAMGMPVDFDACIKGFPDDCRFTALSMCVVHGSLECVEMLLNAGSDPDGVPSDSFDAHVIPLLLAIENQDADCVELLIQAGCDVDAVNGQGSTAAMLACANEDDACLKMLIDAGCGMDAVDSKGDSVALHAGLAHLRGNTSCLNLVSAAVCSNLVQNPGYYTDLGHIAAALGLYFTLDQLLDSGWNPDATDSRGRTAAMFAARSRHDQCLLKLIKAGCDTDARDRDGINLDQLVTEWEGHWSDQVIISKMKACIESSRLSKFTPGPITTHHDTHHRL